MHEPKRSVSALTSVLLLCLGCSAPAPPPAPEQEPPPVEVQSAPAEQPGMPAPVEPPPPANVPATEPATEPVPEPEPEPEPEPKPVALADVVDPGGNVEVAPTKAGTTRIGAAKCKVCHKLQYASWLETAHAKREPPLDCEGCHGPGSEYKGLKVMKDPELARAAGMVDPERAFCERCHVRNWSDELLARSHAHEPAE